MVDKIRTWAAGVLAFLGIFAIAVPLLVILAVIGLAAFLFGKILALAFLGIFFVGVIVFVFIAIFTSPPQSSGENSGKQKAD